MQDYTPLLLSADNFTSLEQTPWAGHSIAKLYKKPIIRANGQKQIGESWEFSCDPTHASKVIGSQFNLLQLIERDREALLGPILGGPKGAGCEILVKLLNAAEPLSLQVHPADGDKALRGNECGKPESWLVLDAEPGAGVYLGFSKKMSKADLAKAITSGEDLQPYLNFVEAKVGDYFEIEPGFPHAVGAGLVLLEPQRIWPGKQGKTYRLWDWGRKYNGKARELHVEAGLNIIDPPNQVGAVFVEKAKRKPKMEVKPGLKAAIYPANAYYQTILLEMDAGSQTNLNVKDGYGVAVMLAGAIEIGNKSFSQGQSIFLPYAAFPMTAKTTEVTKVALVIPSCARFSL